MRVPLVSIVTPAYRAARFISETICSVQAQEFVDWEMLVVNDCSPDETAAVIESFGACDSRVRLLNQPQNAGPAMARQRALEEARGRYIAFLDSDDYWLPGKLDRQIAFMQERNTAFSFTQFRRINVDGSRTGHLMTIPGRLDYRGILKNTAIATSTVILDRALTGPLQMARTYYDDYALWLGLLRGGLVAYGLQQDLTRYRVVSQSVSRSKSRSAYHVWRTYRDIEGLSPVHAAWCFSHYAVRGWLKYRRF